jgi:hypothetical protein
VPCLFTVRVTGGLTMSLIVSIASFVSIWPAGASTASPGARTPPTADDLLVGRWPAAAATAVLTRVVGRVTQRIPLALRQEGR